MVDFPQMNNPQLTALQNQLQGLFDSYERLDRMKEANAASNVSSQQKLPMDVQIVDGDDGARIFLKNMPSNTKGVVFDKSNAVFYGLSRDANGVAAPIQKCPYTIETIPGEINNSITKQDLDEMRNDIQELKTLLSQQSKQTTYRIEQKGQRGTKPGEGVSHEPSA